MSEMDRAYYQRGDIEVVDVIEAWQLGYNLGNVIKYLARAGWKTLDRLEDMKKARWYLDREIANRERAHAVDPVAEVERMRGSRPSGRVPADDVTAAELTAASANVRPDCISPTAEFWRPEGMEGGSFISSPTPGLAAARPHARHLGPCPDNS